MPPFLFSFDESESWISLTLMKSITPPEPFLVKTLALAHSSCFRDFDNSDPWDFSPSWQSSFSASPASCKAPSTLSRISDLCTPCTRYSRKVQTLVVDYACLAPVSLQSLQRENSMLSLLSLGTDTGSTNALLAFCVHTLHYSIEEKQLKLILTFTVSSTHIRFIHSLMKTQYRELQNHVYTIHSINFPSVIFISEKMVTTVIKTKTEKNSY
jgi:hypothetical protein